MTAINTSSPSKWSGAATRARLGAALASSLGRIRAALSWRMGAAGKPDQLLKLNDHLLRDIGLTRAELEYEALFWPIWRPASTRRR